MKVFLTHGHNEVIKLKIKDFIASRLGQEPVILGEQPGRQGLTIIEALEKFSEGCEFAVILLTGDDMTKEGGLRARQNVIHEVGFFQGRLGRAKVVLITEKGVEIPSNLAGLFYLEYERDIKEIFPDLQVILTAKDASASAEELPDRKLDTLLFVALGDGWLGPIQMGLYSYHKPEILVSHHMNDHLELPQSMRTTGPRKLFWKEGNCFLQDNMSYGEQGVGTGHTLMLTDKVDSGVASALVETISNMPKSQKRRRGQPLKRDKSNKR